MLAETSSHTLTVGAIIAETRTQGAPLDSTSALIFAILGHVGVVDGGAVRRSPPRPLLSREAGQTRLFPAFAMSREVGHAPPLRGSRVRATLDDVDNGRHGG